MSGPLRALHAYSGNLYGGVEVMLDVLARLRGLCPAMDPRFALCFDGRIADELRGRGVAVTIVGGVRFSRPWTILAARSRFARSLKADRPDVVVCHAPWSHALYAPVARRAGLPVVFWQHDVASGTHWVERQAGRTAADLAVANSRFTAGSTGRIFGEAPVEVLYCPVPAPPPAAGADRAAVRRELGAGPGTVVLVQASRMDPLKGTHVLIEALGRLAGVPGWVFWLAGGAQRAGEAAYGDQLRARAEALGIAARVRFLGPRSDVPRLLGGGDVYCQANVRPETFGIALVEALHAGLPVVTSRLGGAVEVVDASCGVLVEPADPEALAEALAPLIADPGRRQALGRSGPARARSLCDPAIVLGRIEEVLRRVATSSAGAS